MNRLLMAILLLILSIGTYAAGENPGMADERDRISYSVGYQVGGDFMRQGISINPELMVKGVMDAASEAEPAISQAEMSRVLSDLKRRIIEMERERREASAHENLDKGRAFLQDNGKKEGVMTLPSGLQYEVIKAGDGEPPAPVDTVIVHYRGELIDGTEIDSSYKRGEPVSFRLDRVIKGWSEGLTHMKPGGKSRLVIPPELAYGEKGAGEKIGPNSTLVFEVELVAVKR